MKDLNLIIDTLNSFINLNSEVWDRIKQSINPLENKILELILKSHDDVEEGNQVLKDINLNSVQYQQIKHKLVSKLLKEILVFNPSYYRYSDLQIAFVKSYQQYAIFKIMIGFGQRGLAKKIAFRLNKKAIKYKLTDIRLETGKFLLKYYNEFDPQEDKMKFYLEDIDKAMRSQIAEHQVFLSKERIYNELLNKTNTEIENLFFVKSELVKLEKLKPDSVDSDRFYIDFFLLNIWVFDLEKKYDEAYLHSLKCYEYFKNLPYIHKGGEAQFLLQMTHYSLLMGNYSEARQILSILILLKKNGSKNYVHMMKLKIQLDLTDSKYRFAIDDFREFLLWAPLKNLRLHDKYYLLIVSNYLFFLGLDFTSKDKATINLLEKSIDETNCTSPYYLISDILVQVKKRKWKAVKSRIGSLKLLEKQRIKKLDRNYRTQFFIKMLTTIEEGYFHPTAIKRHAEKYYQKLKLVPYNLSMENSFIEIMPYEIVWEKVLSALETSTSTIKG
ncbi:MAG: hypothetical protein V3V00_09435 [Saprospiraceae bacterium]